MRLPYLQVTQETWSRARVVGGLLGMRRREAFGLLCDLWAWAIDLGPKDQPPTGEVNSAKAVRMLAGALEWEGDPAELADALVEVGVIELTPTGFRVRGLDRYRRTWLKNHGGSGNAGSVPETGANPAPDRRGNGAGTAPQTQTQTHTTTNPPYPPLQGGTPKRLTRREKRLSVGGHARGACAVDGHVGDMTGEPGVCSSCWARWHPEQERLRSAGIAAPWEHFPGWVEQQRAFLAPQGDA